MDYAPDGGADSYNGPKEKPKGDVSIQGGPGFCSFPCDYGSLMSPAIHRCQKAVSHVPLTVLQGSWMMMLSYPNTFQLNIFKMSGLFVLPF
jgi:hypothetical protein